MIGLGQKYRQKRKTQSARLLAQSRAGTHGAVSDNAQSSLSKACSHKPVTTLSLFKYLTSAFTSALHRPGILKWSKYRTGNFLHVLNWKGQWKNCAMVESDLYWVPRLPAVQGSALVSIDWVLCITSIQGIRRLLYQALWYLFLKARLEGKGSDGKGKDRPSFWEWRLETVPWFFLTTKKVILEECLIWPKNWSDEKQRCDWLVLALHHGNYVFIYFFDQNLLSASYVPGIVQGVKL